MTATYILLGLGAGVASALLFASAASGTVLGVLVLFLLSPLPVAIAGLGWGWGTAVIAAVTAASGLILLAGPYAGLVHALAIGVPTVFLSYLVLLSREDATPAGATTEWYPIGRVLGSGAAWSGLLAALALATIATDYEGLRAGLRRSAQRFFEITSRGAGPDAGLPQLNDADITAFAELMTLSFAGSVGMTWMLLSTLNLWLAGRITKASGRLTRPWPDMTLIRLPSFAVTGFALAVLLGLLLSFAGQSYAALIASGFAAAYLFACMLVGLAIVHYHSRNWPLRAATLGLTYASLTFVYPWSHIAVAMLAIAEPLLPIQRPPESTPPPKRPTID